MSMYQRASTIPRWMYLVDIGMMIIRVEDLQKITPAVWKLYFHEECAG
jgi:hypothetical protein